MGAPLVLSVAVPRIRQCPGTRWEIEQGVEVPSYAVAEPTATDLNIDTVVLGCERVAEGRFLQLQLYLSDAGRLRPTGVSSERLADDPRARISIDGKHYPVTPMFADGYVLLADSLRGVSPGLSDGLPNLSCPCGGTRCHLSDAPLLASGRDVRPAASFVEV
jgi:hypothetical protein